MVGLAKLVSSGIAGLSASGLGIYFIPSYSDSKASSKLIYSGEEEELPDSRLDNWKNREREILGETEKLLENFRLALEKLREFTNETHSEIVKAFEEAANSEQELQKAYVKNKSKLEELQKLVEQNFSINQQKLDNSAQLHQTQFINKSLHAIGGTVLSWGQAVETILCSIHKTKGDQECSNLSNWHQENKYDKSDELETKLGGGVDNQGEGSKQAIATLKEVVNQLATKKQKLKELIKVNAGLNMKYWIKQWNQEQSDKFYNHQLDKSRERINTKNQEIQKGVTESNEKAQKLNETYTKLVETNNKWERFKRQSSIIYSYKGLLENTLCTNSQNENMQNCSPLIT